VDTHNPQHIIQFTHTFLPLLDKDTLLGFSPPKMVTKTTISWN